MNPNVIRSVALASVCVLAADLHAQTCVAPLTLEPNTTVPGSTCGHQKVTDVFCDGTPNPGPNVVYRLSLPEPSTVDFAIGTTSPPFDPAVHVSDGSCASHRCASTVHPAQTLPAGDYWVIVGASDQSTEGSCGNYLLANFVTPAPAETIFSDSFD